MAMVSTTLKIVLFTPMPSARHNVVRAVNPGFFTRVRAAYRRSWNRVSIRLLDASIVGKFDRIGAGGRHDHNAPPHLACRRQRSRDWTHTRDERRPPAYTRRLLPHRHGPVAGYVARRQMGGVCPDNDRGGREPATRRALDRANGRQRGASPDRRSGAERVRPTVESRRTAALLHRPPARPCR